MKRVKSKIASYMHNFIKVEENWEAKDRHYLFKEVRENRKKKKTTLRKDTRKN